MRKSSRTIERLSFFRGVLRVGRIPGENLGAERSMCVSDTAPDDVVADKFPKKKSSDENSLIKVLRLAVSLAVDLLPSW